MSDVERRVRRKEIRHLQSESVWLQKAVFALRKAEAAREQVAEIRNEEAYTYAVDVAGREVSLEELEDAIDARVEGLTRKVREMRRNIG